MVLTESGASSLLTRQEKPGYQDCVVLIRCANIRAGIFWGRAAEPRMGAFPLSGNIGASWA